jgi:DNA-directed RNA polymerase subunit L
MALVKLNNPTRKPYKAILSHKYMEIEVLKDEKNELEVKLSSLTIAEVLRVYLNKEGAKLAAWKRGHPTESPVLHIEGDNPKKLLKGAISQIEKEVDSIVADFKKLK